MKKAVGILNIISGAVLTAVGIITLIQACRVRRENWK